MVIVITRSLVEKNMKRIFLEAFGKRMSLSDWAKETGIKEETIRSRLCTYKLPVE